MRELETRIARGALFSAVYLDLDNFKAFNDRYGFTRGDEALRLTARLTAISVRQGAPHDSFVGHVGGDDFLFLLPIDTAETVCQQLIELFDQMIRSLYDDEERRQGCIRSVNRKGEQETFPLMSISLAVVPNYGARFTHPGQISSVAAELKKFGQETRRIELCGRSTDWEWKRKWTRRQERNGKGKGHKQDPDEK
jgi:diguanylate cyclase (GGDEF)-like protein